MSDSMDGMSKEEWRRSMLLNTPDEAALEAKLARVKEFKQKRKETTTLQSNDSKNRKKSWKSSDEAHKDEIARSRRTANMQREQTRRLPDYLAKTDKPPAPPYIKEYKAAVAGGPRGQATVMFEDADDALKFAQTTTKHASAVALAIPALPLEARAIDNSIHVEDLTTPAGKLLPVDRSLLPPLEHFELEDFLEKDKPNEEWLANGPTSGAVPYWVDGEWTWVSADVLSYDSDTQRFMVRVRGDPGGAKKRASMALGGEAAEEDEEAQPVKGVVRLNLRFEDEDPVMFEQRRRAAEEGRKAVITSLRFDKMVMARNIPKVTDLLCSAT
jgi:hypothetical protein